MAANNSTVLATGEDPIANLTTALATNQTFFEKLASTPTKLVQHSDLLLLEFRIVFTALALIYIGSHGALRRPPSARLNKNDKKGKKREDREDQFVQGLLPSDVIVFPILAGTVLVGLYYLIKWLEDPDILNKILRVYFSGMSLASMGKLFADGLHLLTGFVFPSVWAGKDGKLYHIDPKKRRQWYAVGNSGAQVWDDSKKTPLPGLWSSLNLSDTKRRMLWEVRHLLFENWTVRFYVHGLVNEHARIKLNDILGFTLAVGANIVYYTTQSPFLSNVMGWAFSYTGIILLSPTTFATGSGLLFGLFFYDIYMVFYTPYMVTVATKLDVPVKLVFEGPTKSSMLGLGDIVIPGIFVGLCLRFDHYMYYYRQRKLVPVELKTEDQTSGELVTNQETQRMVIKPDYINPQGQWGDRFWGTKISKIFSPAATPSLKASAFPKTYFHASIVGYLLGMMATLMMLLTFNHAQPALLYLVPGVVFTVWITGAVRGEIKDMWSYTEDGSLDKKDVLVEVDGNGDVIKEVHDGKDDEKTDVKVDAHSAVDGSQKNESSSKEAPEEADKISSAEKEVKKSKAERYPVFSVSIEAPAPGHSS